MRFEPETRHVQWGSPRLGEPAEHVPYVPACRSRYAADRGGDFALDNVEGLGKAFSLDLIVKPDPLSNTTLIDACIGRRRTLITQRFKLRSDRLDLFVWDGAVVFDELAIRPLIE